MVSAVYCPDCGVRSNPQRVKCDSCGVTLPSQVKKNPLYAKVTENRPKAAVFDLDGTVFDNFQRFKDARRAGIVNDRGLPIQKGRESMGSAWKKRNKFLYTKKNLAKDTLIPGAKETIDSLTNDGYIIVYLTARPREYYTEILGQLESNGLPLFRDSTDRVMLITKPPGSPKAAQYKGDEVRKLRGEFDVRMVFDDDLDALAEISKYDVPGLYSSVSDYVKVNPRVRRNGNHFGVADEHRGETYVIGTDNIDTAYRAMPDPDDPDGRTVGQTLGEGGYAPPVEDPEEDERVITADSIQASLEDFVKKNPVKRGKDSKGGYYKWGKGKKYHYKTGSERSRNTARKKAYEQAKAAYAGGYRKNPTKKKKFKIHTGDISGTKKGSVYATVQVGRNVVMDVGEGIQDVYRGLVGGRQSMTEKRLAMGVAEMEKDLMDQAKKLGANAVSNLQIDYEPQYRGEVTILATGEAVKTRASVKKNPANPKKVEKGKKLYKHMNGQEPEKINVEKIDIGDVWYKVGEGGCWQIGYMSGKETGQESQKYIHTFNEETKDGNFPELYATMPEKGKPMLIIKGGTWKIRTDDTGVAWIYD